MSRFILAIDQGTTSSRGIVFNQEFDICGVGQEEFTQHFPQSGWVEHNPEDIWQSTLNTCKTALKNANINPEKIQSIGITNQRETTLIWNRKTGELLHRAIVWQDRRTANKCRKLKNQFDESQISSKTGLLLDPYFCATKIDWILDRYEGARKLAEQGKLAFGTVDCFLIWRLTGGRVHATDATNASRTLLYNIHNGEWDDELLSLFNIPKAILPQVKDSADDYGVCDKDLFGVEIPINGVAGDQHAATVGQACFKPGMLKSTYGTGTFAVLNTGTTAVRSKNRLLTTIAYQLDGVTTYALEGSIFVAGAAVQWLRDGLGVIESAEQTQVLAETADPNQNIYLVPAFTGLGAPYWDADARGALYGLTRNTGPAEITKATLESVGYQTRDLIEAMQRDWQSDNSKVMLRVDGGMSKSNWTMQFIANMLQAPVDRPYLSETTALGAAYLAGRYCGLYPDMDTFSDQWQLERQFTPNTDQRSMDKKYKGWLDCIRRTRSHYPSKK